jgi:hypothetical protein
MKFLNFCGPSSKTDKDSEKASKAESSTVGSLAVLSPPPYAGMFRLFSGMWSRSGVDSVNATDGTTSSSSPELPLLCVQGWKVYHGGIGWRISSDLHYFKRWYVTCDLVLVLQPPEFGEGNGKPASNSDDIKRSAIHRKLLCVCRYRLAVQDRLCGGRRQRSTNQRQSLLLEKHYIHDTHQRQDRR